MIDVQCHWWFVEDMLGYQMLHYKFLYGWWFYDKIDVKVKFCTFVFISAAIWKGCNWVRRSKIILIVSLNMVYHIPVWKQETWGLTGAKNMYFFRPKSKKCYLWWDNPQPDTKPNLNKCRKVQRSKSSNKIDLSWFIQVLLHI